MHKTLFSQDLLPFLAQAAPAGAPAGQAPGPFGLSPGSFQVVFIGLMLAAMYFLMIAPQRKKQKELQKMLSELKPGDEVLTTGGIFGTISSVRDDRFVVRIGDNNTKVEIGKAFVQTVVKRADGEKK
jgi:preprotein translocase subunit YajC